MLQAALGWFNCMARGSAARQELSQVQVWAVAPDEATKRSPCSSVLPTYKLQAGAPADTRDRARPCLGNGCLVEWLWRPTPECSRSCALASSLVLWSCSAGCMPLD